MWCRTDTDVVFNVHVLGLGRAITGMEIAIMNMNFQRPHTAEVRYKKERFSRSSRCGARRVSESITKYGVLSVSGLLLAYGLDHASTTILIAVAGGVLAFIGVAIAVCVHASNYTPW